MMVMQASTGRMRSRSKQELSGATLKRMPSSAACIIFPMTRAQIRVSRMRSAVSRTERLVTRVLLEIKSMARLISPVWR